MNFSRSDPEKVFSKGRIRIRLISTRIRDSSTNEAIKAAAVSRHYRSTVINDYEINKL